MQPLREKLDCATVGCAWERLSAQPGDDAQAGQAAICSSMQVRIADTPAGCVVCCVAAPPHSPRDGTPYVIGRGCLPAAQPTTAGVRTHLGSFPLPVVPDVRQQPLPHGPHNGNSPEPRSVPACTGLHTLQEQASTLVTPKP